ncbi:transporter [uncultured Eudoraea sp.]|uniref:transporter n=1 Tax=uncultured Eudoraea sp. TaxID=1035614 RepID=UPI00260A49E7|nr:transporter [uncultured Eudoraea sp.]
MFRVIELKIIKNAIFLLALLTPLLGICQYTDVINSNRPGLSVSAYAVGKGVPQLELGFSYEKRDHADLNYDSNIYGLDFSVRYGLLLENLELNWEGTYQNQIITYNSLGFIESRTNFSRNRLGAKYLVFDPFKNPERNKPNLYSWKANNKFEFKNLIPAISVYAGANFVIGDNPFYPADPTVSPRVMLATQSRLTPRFVLISNISYDRIATDDPELGYTLSLSHALRNPKWSIFLENQGVSSDRYSDILLRGGGAYLVNENFQVDANLGGSFKNSPSRLFVSVGASYRLDFHKDVLIPIEDQKAGENGGPIKKNSMKKKTTKGRKKGKGAEDIDLGPSKKDMKKQKKDKKKKTSDKGVIDF